MGCIPARAGRSGIANSKNTRKLSREESMNDAGEKKPNVTEVDYVVQLVAGYMIESSQKGTVTTYNDYRGFEITTMNHVAKNKVDRLCKWSDQALQDRLNLNNDVFFNPQNPLSWPKEVLTNHLSTPSFADRNTIHEMACSGSAKRRGKGRSGSFHFRHNRQPAESVLYCSSGD